MPNLNLFFTLHPPVRLRPYPALEIGLGTGYQDPLATYDLWNRLSASSYIPALRLLIRLARNSEGKFKFSLFVPGYFWEEAGRHAPEVQALLRELNATGQVEWIGGPYFPSLAFVLSPQEFERQVEMQENFIEETFGQKPEVMLNTDLMYHHLVGYFAYRAGYKAVIAEGNERFLNGKSFNYLYHPAHRAGFPVILRHPHLSEDLSHRFGDSDWTGYPLNAEKFAGWLADAGGEVLSLGVPLESMGFHQPASTGIFDFWSELPGQVLSRGMAFHTASEIAEKHHPGETYGGEDYIHWLDRSHDLQIWKGNSWQNECLEQLYALEEAVMTPKNAAMLPEWHWLQLADHLLFMSEISNPEGVMSLRNGPFKSPSDAYICFSNALSDFRLRLKT